MKKVSDNGGKNKARSVRPDRFAGLNENVSKESSNWITACLDPYADYQYDVRGLPDERTAPSVVQIHNQSITLSIPTSASGGNWDASIMYSGVNSLINPDARGGLLTVSSSSMVPWNGSSFSTGAEFGALTLWAGAAGSTMSTGAPYTSGDYYGSLGSNLGTDRCRLIGVGIEVHNTTAEIYKQGTFTIAQLPDNAEDSTNIQFLNSSALAATIFDVKECQAERCCIQASTVGPLQNVPGACVWAASEGAYIIPRMTKVPREVLSYATGAGAGGHYGANSRNVIVYGTDGKTAVNTPVDYLVSTTPAKSSPIFRPFGSSGFSPVQLFASGLSAQTTLTVTFRTIVEYFPALGSTLLPLAEPSPCFDPRALMVYSETMRFLPIAVPVDQNASGDYWKKVLRILGQALKMTAPLFGTYSPIALGVGSVLSSKFQKN
jgi:hypothetical protein